MRLVAQGLACERNGREIFRGLSFAVGPGEHLELRGANGAGKSTLLRLIAGLVPISEGGISLESAGEDAIRLQCHYAGHQEAIKHALSVRDNLAFWASAMGGGGVEEAMALFSLEKLADQPALILSAGQRRRLSLARLMLSRRAIWLLDEPATALDATHRQAFVALAVKHLAAGGMVIAATHEDWGLVPTQTLYLGPAP